MAIFTVNNQMGTVEGIGIKTSHILSLSGEQLIMPNAELVKSVIQNFKRFEKRRVVFKLGVVMETKDELLQAIPQTIKRIILDFKENKFDRCHLSDIGEPSINFEVVYFVDSPDYNLFMDIQQKIYLDIIQEFRNKEIEMAYPTRTLIVERNDEIKFSASSG